MRDSLETETESHVNKAKHREVSIYAYFSMHDTFFLFISNLPQLQDGEYRRPQTFPSRKIFPLNEIESKQMFLYNLKIRTR